MGENIDERVRNSGDNAVVLRGKKLRELVDVVRREEVNLFTKMKYDNSGDLLKLLAESQAARKETLELIDQPKFRPSPVSKEQAKIDEVFYKYLEWVEPAAGLGITMYQNLKLRRHYLNKVRAYADDLITRGNTLVSLNPTEFEQEVRSMLEELVFHADVVRSATIFDASDATQRWDRPKLNGRTLGQVVQSYYSKLVEKGRFPPGQTFEQLGDLVKAQVYVEILLTWKSQVSWPNLTKLKTGAAAALVLFMVGMSVYDVYKSDHKAKKIFTEAAEFAGGYWGSSLGELVASIAAKAAPALIAAPELSGPLVGLIIFGTGCVGGYFAGIATGVVVDEEANLIGNFAGWVHDEIIGSGGKHAGGVITVQQHEDRPPHSPPNISNKLRFYRVPMPDGAALALQIASQKDEEKS